MSLMLAGVMSLSLLASDVEPDAESYAAAYRAIAESGRPMVVLVGADWCPPCQAMRRYVLPELRKRRWFGKIAFARVNSDEEAALARRLTGGGPIPQLVMFRKTGDGWTRRKLIGRHGVETVERFIEQGIALDEAGKLESAARLTSRQRTEEVDRSEDATKRN